MTIAITLMATLLLPPLVGDRGYKSGMTMWEEPNLVRSPYLIALRELTTFLFWFCGNFNSYLRELGLRIGIFGDWDGIFKKLGALLLICIIIGRFYENVLIKKTTFIFYWFRYKIYVLRLYLRKEICIGGSFAFIRTCSSLSNVFVVHVF